MRMTCKTSRLLSVLLASFSCVTQFGPVDMEDRTMATWFHARSVPVESFGADQPAFFAERLEDLEMWGEGGHVVEAEIRCDHPVRDLQLHEIALGLGLPDVFDPDFSEFPDVSSYLYDRRVRRILDERGFDGFAGEDGYLFVTVVWNPDQIAVLSHRPFDEALAELRERTP